MTAKHVHDFRKIGPERARCVVCHVERRLEELVYLGDAPRSCGPGSSWR